MSERDDIIAELTKPCCKGDGHGHACGEMHRGEIFVCDDCKLYARVIALLKPPRAIVVYHQIGDERGIYAVCASIGAAAKAEARCYSENKDGICWADSPREVEE